MSLSTSTRSHSIRVGPDVVLKGIRISVLILIGHAGARSIAIGGFDSQAGSIAFNAVALGFCLAATHLPWILVRRRSVEVRAAENPTAVYLVPFLVILATTLLSRAMSGTFEWSYPLRVVAAAGALWWLRRQYRQMDWSFTWAGPVVAGLVFALWVGLDSLSPAHENALGQVSPASARCPESPGWHCGPSVPF